MSSEEAYRLSQERRSDPVDVGVTDDLIGELEDHLLQISPSVSDIQSKVLCCSHVRTILESYSGFLLRVWRAAFIPVRVDLLSSRHHRALISGNFCCADDCSTWGKRNIKI